MTWKSESNRPDALEGQCLECGEILHPGITRQWTLRKTFAMHEEGTGHKKFSVTRFLNFSRECGVA